MWILVAGAAGWSGDLVSGSSSSAVACSISRCQWTKYSLLSAETLLLWSLSEYTVGGVWIKVLLNEYNMSFCVSGWVQLTSVPVYPSSLDKRRVQVNQCSPIALWGNFFENGKTGHTHEDNIKGATVFYTVAANPLEGSRTCACTRHG